MLIAEITLSAQAQQLLKRLQESLQKDKFFSALLGLFDKLAQRAAAWVITTQLSGQNLKRRTGQLARAVVGRAEIYNGVPAFRVGVFRGPALKYAGIMEHGTRGLNPESPYDTLRPKNAKALAMPVDDATTPAGVARWPSPRDYPGTLKFVPYRNGTKAIGGLYEAESLKQSRGDLTQARRLYVLLRELDLPPHHYLRDGLRTFIPRIIPELVAFMRDVLSGLQQQSRS